jgi:hypothetical protein
LVSEVTKVKVTEVLDILVRLSRMHDLNDNTKNLIENARNTVIPPEQKAIKSERITVMQA